MQKYTVNQYTIDNILAFVKAGEIAIPEIQRPFVWKKSKVRDLLDSLYQGFPVGYVISWRNPDVKLKDGSLSMGKKVLIDGQQRIMALTTSLLGQQVVDANYNKVVIKIAFHPIEQRFEVLNSSIEKDKSWIQDVSGILTSDFSTLEFIKNYLMKNPESSESVLEKNLQMLRSILQHPVGTIELHHDLDVETVTEIFIRINSKGVVLSQADFVMSKIAANETYGGSDLRKAIDYFCHLVVKPEFFTYIQENDSEFSRTEYFNKMSWLRRENEDIYDPNYSDVLRVALLLEFKRGRLSDLVGLLSGRDFETRSYEEHIAEDTFSKLKKAVFMFMNETDFKGFVMIIKSAGFVSSKLITSQNALNFSYGLFLHLRSKGENRAMIERIVRRWFVMSVMLGRYSGSPESQFDKDIRSIDEKGVEKVLADIEAAYLDEGFWISGVIQKLTTSSINAPMINVFWAAQAKANYKGFLSRDITVKEMLEHRGDVHHIFPKALLIKHGFTRSQYNQVANYAYAQQEINIKIGAQPPVEYLSNIESTFIRESIESFSGLDTLEAYQSNLEESALPLNLSEFEVEVYHEFLEIRRTQMAKIIKAYYFAL